jgi:dipeptidyl-peptidase-4
MIIKQIFRIIQVSILLSLTIILNGQRPRMRDTEPGLIKWIDDNHMLFRTLDDAKKPVIVDYNCKTGKSVEVSDYMSDMQKLRRILPTDVMSGTNQTVSGDYKAVVISRDSDLWYYDGSSIDGRRLTNDEGLEVNMRFAPGDRKIAYTKDKDLYVYDLDQNREIRLTSDATDRIYNGWASWVYYEEILGRPSRYAAFWWSPDAEHIAYLHTDDNPVPLYYINALDQGEGLHGRLETTPYPKAGDPNPVVKMGIAEIASAKTTWVKTDESVDQYIAWPSWTPDSRELMIQVLNRDQNDMRFILADVATGDFKEVYHETSNTWVDFFEDVYVMNNGNGFIIRSYRDNRWHNLYYYGWDGSLKSQITGFDWKVTSIVRVDEERGEIYFNATGPGLIDSHLYRSQLDGSRLKQITSGEGSHSASVSPGGSWFVDSWSSIADPGGINLIDRSGKTVRNLYRQEVAIFDPDKQQRSEIVKIKTSDSLFDLPALITYPVRFDPSKKYPVIFTVYGGPDMGNIQNRWQGYQPQWYAENGIVTIDIDHRGSGEFGKRGLDFVFRSLGKWEISDYSDAVKWLRKQSWVDSTRMGITGGSYGGYVTCLALTRGADYWTHGIADYSVTDWRLYDNFYTERYMDTPENNPDGYRNGSVITWVENLKGNLLIRHGEIDDNVHLQNAIWLVSALQDLNKPFEMMIYPGGRHGSDGPKRAFMIREENSFWLKNFFDGDFE